MKRYYYKKDTSRAKKIIARLGSLIFVTIGLVLVSYIFFPLISWQIYFAPIFAAQDVAAPIPKSTVLTGNSLKSLLNTSVSSLRGLDYTNASNWFPSVHANASEDTQKKSIPSYLLTIAKLNIHKAVVSTTSTDLSLHLINYPGTAIPPHKGNAVVFGHSTLPQLFDPKDYKTIFANAYKLAVGDEIMIHGQDITYTYRVFNITVVDADDTSIFAQDMNDSYLTIVTCTPPGTTWKRLIIKAKLQTI